MREFERYGVYYLPDEEDALADFGAAWLGWDIDGGRATEPAEIAGLPRDIAALTEAPRRYGFHATIKPPFHLAEGEDADGLDAAMSGLCNGLAPAEADGLKLASYAGFVALLPTGEVSALNALAGEIVRGLDAFRAPPDEDELARRRRPGLSERQEANLAAWGYPYVMEDFAFHMTLTGHLPPAEAEAVIAALGPRLAPLLPEPFRVDAFCLVGEDGDGRFHLIHRYPLKGVAASDD